jgi:hypothetical protein
MTCRPCGRTQCGRFELHGSFLIAIADGSAFGTT